MGNSLPFLGKRDGQPVVGGRSSHNLVFNIRVEKSVIRTFILCLHGKPVEDVFGDELRPFHTSVETKLSQVPQDPVPTGAL